MHGVCAQSRHLFGWFVGLLVAVVVITGKVRARVELAVLLGLGSGLGYWDGGRNESRTYEGKNLISKYLCQDLCQGLRQDLRRLSWLPWSM